MKKYYRVEADTLVHSNARYSKGDVLCEVPVLVAEHKSSVREMTDEEVLIYRSDLQAKAAQAEDAKAKSQA